MILGDKDQRYIDDTIHYLMEIPWAVLGLLFFETYFLAALFFAALLMLPGDHVSGAGAHRFLDSFHFSLQTLSTIGYGGLSPATPWAHTVVMIESYAGMVMIALGGGVLFSRVNRPRPRVGFSEIMTVHKNKAGEIKLSTRMLNCQKSAWLDAHVSINVIFQDGNSRKLRPLKLGRDFTPVFRGGWMLTHTIDDSSPLSGLMTDSTVHEQIGAFLVFVKGVDASFQKHVYTSHVYHTSQDLRFGHWFETMMDYGSTGITVRKDMLSVTHTDAEEAAMGHRSSYMQ
jgi:inward rectifier potassium channel